MYSSGAWSNICSGYSLILMIMYQWGEVLSFLKQRPCSLRSLFHAIFLGQISYSLWDTVLYIYRSLFSLGIILKNILSTQDIMARRGILANQSMLWVSRLWGIFIMFILFIMLLVGALLLIFKNLLFFKSYPWKLNIQLSGLIPNNRVLKENIQVPWFTSV